MPVSWSGVVSSISSLGSLLFQYGGGRKEAAISSKTRRPWLRGWLSGNDTRVLARNRDQNGARFGMCSTRSLLTAPHLINFHTKSFKYQSKEFYLRRTYTKPTWGVFLESSGNFSGPESCFVFVVFAFSKSKAKFQ